MLRSRTAAGASKTPNHNLYLPFLAVWFLLALVILCEGLYAILYIVEGPERRETLLSVFYQLWLLNAPLGFIISGFASDVLAPHNIVLFSVTSGIGQFLSSWTLVSLIGFVQWFALLPAVIKFSRHVLRRHRAKRRL